MSEQLGRGGSGDRYDVVVIGGGPAGSTLSMFLVRKGYRVLLLEREKFPRFHVGESLIPSTQTIWERLGLAEQMQHLGHTFKYAGEFRFGRDPRSPDFESTIAYFNNTPASHRSERPFAYQVDRAEFDEWLLNQARSKGVEVIEQAVVKEILWEGDRARGVRWKAPDGTVRDSGAEVVADCSGRHAFISRSRKFLVPDTSINTSAVFGQFKHVSRDPGLRQGYFNGYFIENGWMWFIPLKDDIMSVGVVMNKPGTDWWGNKNPEEILTTYINRYKFVRDRFLKAELYSKVRTLRGLPYRSTRCTGDGWILVGDANFFVDPLYSSGVQIAFHSAENAFNAIDRFLSENRSMAGLEAYERWAQNYAFHVFTHMGMIYRLLRYRTAIESAVRLTGRLSNHWDNWLLRRINTFSIGYFDDFHWALYAIWPHMYAMYLNGRLRQKLTGLPAWDTHRQFCTEPPLTIPKSAEYHGKDGRMPARNAAAVRDENFPERWIVPMDLAGESEAEVRPGTALGSLESGGQLQQSMA